MSDDENVILEKDDFEKLTPQQKATHVRDLKTRKRQAINTLNAVVKALAELGEETDLEVYEQDDTKTQKKIDRDAKVHNLPQTIKGPKYPQVLDKTGLPKNK